MYIITYSMIQSTGWHIKKWTIPFRCLQHVYNILTNLLKTQPKLLPKNLTFRPLSEAFIRRNWYSVLPVLDTTGRRRVKKAVICVAQLVAALITVHGLLSFLPDVYGLFDPSGKTLWLSVDHCRLRPVDDMVLLGCVVGESGFVMFC